MASKKRLPVTKEAGKSDRGASLRGCAKELGISHVRLLALVREGRVPRNQDGSFDVDATRAAFLAGRDPAQVSKVAAALAPEQGAPDGAPKRGGEGGFFDTKNEHEKLKLRLTQIDLDIKEGRIVETDQVMRAVGAMILTAKTALLAMANDLADELAAEGDPVIVRSTLGDKIHQILSELSRWKLEPEAMNSSA